MITENQIHDDAQAPVMRQALEAIARTTFSGSDMDNDYMRGNRDAHATCSRMAKAALASQPPAAPVETEPVAYVNGDELANLLDDRTTLIQGTKSGWRRTPLYTKPHFHSSAGNEGRS